MYGIKCNNWGGESCLGPYSKCTELKTRDMCNRAWNNHKIHCIGWAMYDNDRHGSCLDWDKDVRKIKHKMDCDLIVKNHRDHVKGWSGERCIANWETDCRIIKDPVMCRQHIHYGFVCNDWGGSYCLPKDADASEITDPGLCRESMTYLRLPSRGWGGTKCITESNANCQVIRDQAICEDSLNRLNISCGGWSDGYCWDAPQKTKDGREIPQTSIYPSSCSKIFDQKKCDHSVPRYGMTCSWDEIDLVCIDGLGAKKKSNLPDANETGMLELNETGMPEVEGRA